MIDDPSIPGFHLTGGTLRVSGDLRSGDEGAFEKALEDLLDAPEKVLTVDFCSVDYIASSYVRHVAMAILRAKDEDRPFTIRAGRRVAPVLAMGGVDKLATIMITNGEPESS